MRIVLAGAHGHGGWHLRNIRRLAQDGGATLVGVCDLVPVHPEALSGLGRPAQGRDLARLIEDVRPDVTIVCTPIQTHADLAVLAMEAGSHVLVEKPPAPGRSEFERMLSGAERTGRACQVGFQDLGSAALPVIARAIDADAIGRVARHSPGPRPSTSIPRRPHLARSASSSRTPPHKTPPKWNIGSIKPL
ncbi:MAG TPA: Gfo/Idh/MocA family oxidoreductase [Streptosporangiaceae bacterium]|nr:Gfo/Idh/MocA family oxidoreductase [Streptosporangiaceae bacterium]